MEQAKHIEDSYHKMYQVADAYVLDKIKQASKDGYVTVAFGLRLRTPILSQVLMNNESTPYEAQSEARTAGNALGQSYGMLNNRAAIEFQERTLASKYRLSIRPIAHIHDASYYLVRDDLSTVQWVNDNLIECMAWQDLPDIQHPTVKLGGALDIFYPTWAQAVTLPNHATKQEIRELCVTYKETITA